VLWSPELWSRCRGARTANLACNQACALAGRNRCCLGCGVAVVEIPSYIAGLHNNVADPHSKGLQNPYYWDQHASECLAVSKTSSKKARSRLAKFQDFIMCAPSSIFLIIPLASPGLRGMLVGLGGAAAVCGFSGRAPTCKGMKKGSHACLNVQMFSHEGILVFHALSPGSYKLYTCDPQMT